MLTAKENMLRVIHKDHPEWVPCGMESQLLLVPPIVERPGQTGKDDWGVSWIFEGDGGTFPDYKKPLVSDPEKWREQIHFPDVEGADWSKIGLGWEGKPIDLNTINHEEHIVTGALLFGVFERMYLLLGMENTLIYLMEEPELIAEIADALADYNIRMIRKFRSMYPLDIIRYGDDWGNQRQLMMSPTLWRQIFRPAVQKIYDAIHEGGMLVFQHSCGKIEDIMGDLVEMGVDIWDPCQPCNDLAMLKKEYGDHVTFCGGIDSQHVLGIEGISEEAVRQEVRSCIDKLGAGGGYIARPSHDLPYADYIMDAMWSEVRTYGKY